MSGFFISIGSFPRALGKERGGGRAPQPRERAAVRAEKVEMARLPSLDSGFNILGLQPGPIGQRL